MYPPFCTWFFSSLTTLQSKTKAHSFTILFAKTADGIISNLHDIKTVMDYVKFKFAHNLKCIFDFYKYLSCMIINTKHTNIIVFWHRSQLFIRYESTDFIREYGIQVQMNISPFPKKFFSYLINLCIIRLIFHFHINEYLSSIMCVALSICRFL